MKKVLVYCWDSVCEPMTIRAMKESGYQVLILNEKMHDYHADAGFAQKFITFLHAEKPDVVFSYDYFPLISMICQMNAVPYAAWIYDCPQYTLLSKTITNECNHIFCFDEDYTVRLQQLGAKNVCHFPLAADMELYGNAMHQMESKKPLGRGNVSETGMNGTGKYASDISFVGSLYNDEKNRLLSADLSEHTAGYVEGLIRAQQKIYGYNLIKESFADEIVNEIVGKCRLTLGDAYVTDPVQMASDAINMEVTSRDRQDVLAVLALYFDVDLYTNSKLPEALAGMSKLRIKGTVDYQTQMPLVFYNSKINLNITSRTIETGVPQRVFDILACGGFCLTNYQKEISDLFEDGKELVMYTGLEDLVQKVEYYLKHEEERDAIAKAGYEKVKEYFNIDKRIQELLNRIE